MTQILNQLDMTDFTVQNVLLATILPAGSHQVLALPTQLPCMCEG